MIVYSWFTFQHGDFIWLYIGLPEGIWSGSKYGFIMMNHQETWAFNGEMMTNPRKLEMMKDMWWLKRHHTVDFLFILGGFWHAPFFAQLFVQCILAADAPVAYGHSRTTAAVRELGTKQRTTDRHRCWPCYDSWENYKAYQHCRESVLRFTYGDGSKSPGEQEILDDVSPFWVLLHLIGVANDFTRIGLQDQRWREALGLLQARGCWHCQ